MTIGIRASAPSAMVDGAQMEALEEAIRKNEALYQSNSKAIFELAKDQDELRSLADQNQVKLEKFEANFEQQQATMNHTIEFLTAMMNSWRKESQTNAESGPRAPLNSTGFIPETNPVALNQEAEIVGEFNKLEQSGELQDYNERFKNLRAGMLVYNPSLPKEYFVSSYISGLRYEIRALVKIGRPIDLVEAKDLSRLHWEAVRGWIIEIVLVEESESTGDEERAAKKPEINEEAQSAKVHSCSSLQDEIVEVASKELRELVILLNELIELGLANGRTNSLVDIGLNQVGKLETETAHKVFDKMPNRVVENNEFPIRLRSENLVKSFPNWLFAICCDVLCSDFPIPLRVRIKLQSRGHGYTHSAGFVYSVPSSFERGDADFGNPRAWPFDRGKDISVVPQVQLYFWKPCSKIEVLVISVFDPGITNWCYTWSAPNSMQGIHGSHPRCRVAILVYDPGGTL